MNNDIEQIVSIMYQAGNWNIEQVRSFVKSGGITPEQFTQITGQPYEVSPTPPQTTKSQQITSSVTTQPSSGKSSTQIQENVSARG